MTVTVIGQKNDYTRISTGLFSVDSLLSDHLGNVGWPGSTITEIYGPELIGKSTLTVYLAGKLSAASDASLIPIADLEASYDEIHLANNLGHSGFSGQAELLAMIDKKGKPRSHEDVLDDLLKGLQGEHTVACILDSVGALAPLAEINNPLGSANMGKRGFLMAQFSRKALAILRSATRPKFIFLVNHQYEALGKFGGRITPGGKSKGYAASQRITMYNKERFDSGDMLVALRTDKKRFGGNQKQARGYVYIIPGYGVSAAMTALFDAIISGYARRTQGGITLDGTHYGKLKTLREKTMNGDDEWAEMFTLALQQGGFTDSEEEDDDNETVDE